MKRLKLETIIARLKRHRPLNALDLLLKCKLPLEFVGDGQFRNVFRISGTPYIVKVPKIAGGGQDVGHSRREINALKYLSKPKYVAIHPYLPTFHFSNRNTGIVLTDLCTWASYAKYYDTVKEIAEWSEDHGFYEADVDHDKFDNYGVLDGQLKILDLGCFVSGGGSNC